MTWDESFNILKEFIAEKKTMPKFIEEYKGISVGGWCSDQRVSYNKEKLNQDKIKKLEALGDVWYWAEKRTKECWDESFNILKEFVEEKKTMPKQTEEYKGIKIGDWYSYQKRKYSNEKLNDDKIKKLEALGDAWYWAEKKTSKTFNWDESYNILKEFVEEKKVLPKCIEEYKGIKIGSWCFIQRNNYNNEKLNDDKIQKLEALGDVWYWSEKRTCWDVSFNILKEYMTKKRKIPKYIVEYKGIKIGIWCAVQRRTYNEKKLNDDKIQKLEALGDAWYWTEKKTSKPLTWDESYNILKEFVETNPLPSKEEYKEIKIWGWCCTQRLNYNNKILNDERKQKLEALGDAWHWT